MHKFKVSYLVIAAAPTFTLIISLAKGISETLKNLLKTKLKRAPLENVTSIDMQEAYQLIHIDTLFESEQSLDFISPSLTH
jgi:hypothetical protein